MARDLCWGCRQFRDIAWTEESTARPYCPDCAAQLPPTAEEQAFDFLMRTLPFKPGDRVECRTAAQLFDGVGTVQKISMDLENGGTLVYPAFLVKIDEKAYDSAPDECWYTEICLTHLTNAEQTP